MKTEKIICPFCEVGCVERNLISPLQQEVLLCDQCEALWLPDQTISAEASDSLGAYLKNRGIDEKDVEVKLI